MQDTECLVAREKVADEFSRAPLLRINNPPFGRSDITTLATEISSGSFRKHRTNALRLFTAPLSESQPFFARVSSR